MAEVSKHLPPLKALPFPAVNLAPRDKIVLTVKVEVYNDLDHPVVADQIFYSIPFRATTEASA